MAKAKPKQAAKSSWLDRNVIAGVSINWETAIFALILILAFATRFFDLGARVMSHDETSHVYFSWQLFQGNGYAHSALTHGPLQFHLIAFFYFLLGDNDFTARIPMALFSVATVAIAWNFRRYIGRIGALIAAALFLISPYMLYYGRYARNEAFVGLFGLAMLWAILKYLDRGKTRYLYYLTTVTALHFASKETSFIYLAQALLFLGFLFLQRMNKRDWVRPAFKQYFLIGMLAVGALLVVSGVLLTLGDQPIGAELSATEVAEPVVAGDAEVATHGLDLPGNVIILLALAGLSLIGSLFFLVRGYGWQMLRQERAFSLMVLLFSLVLPHLAAFPITWLGGNALDYSSPENLTLISIVVAVLAIIGAGLGLAWKPRVWLINLAIFYAIFVPLFTTIFTNTNGFFSGLVGSLGYWIEQQGVQRGNQPPYYYWGVQIPIYEYLAAIGTLLAGWMGLHIFRTRDRTEKIAEKVQSEDLGIGESRQISLVLFVYWTITSLIAYTVAGEKMPWLTYHIALPMILLTGWAFGRLIARFDYTAFREKKGWLTAGVISVFFLALLNVVGTLLGSQLPFQGQESHHLQSTYQFVFQLILVVGSAYWLTYLMTGWDRKQGQYLLAILMLVGLGALTTRTSFRAAYIEYDNATEYLVYAHMARGPKEVIERVEELSARIEDGNTMVVAYDNETSYPFWWYLRNFPNQRYYGEQPSRELLDASVIIVGDTNYGKIEPIVRNNFYEYEYIRIWWPNQDYFDFTESSIGFEFTQETGLPTEDMGQWEYLTRVGGRLWEYLGDAQMREAIFDIWMNRDYADYFAAKNQNIDLTNWNPSRTMRMYVRKDIVAQIWDFGAEPVADVVLADPYEGKGIELGANLAIGSEGSAFGDFNNPRGMAVAPDGSLYVADANNHRVQHFAPNGDFLNGWGEFGSLDQGDAPGGAFNEPWGVAVSPDGDFIYVADTWNHRIQQFSANGEFVRAWGVFGQGEDAYAMWGPRDVAVDANGLVYVSDTGNKRIKIFDSRGNFLSQFGFFGFDLGNFDEPVGIAIDRDLNVLYVADTWNQRVQSLDISSGFPVPIAGWDISGWFGQSLENKPYLAVGPDSRVYINDPEAGRVLVYEADGSFVNYWGGFDQSAVFIGVAQGIAVDDEGNVWVSDSAGNQVLRFLSP